MHKPNIMLRLKRPLPFLLTQISDNCWWKQLPFNQIRVKCTSNRYCTTANAHPVPESIVHEHDEKSTRNVGIMAHIDAGKTTTTERILFYSGTINYLGEVHHGDTTTDFLAQERERGITIQSAVVGYNWAGSHVNLIDTPGHVDFTFEVERCLRVVDSAVGIIDGSAGVEAQTLTVWRQATSYDLPRLIYINKMDKKSSSIPMCLESIKNKLKVDPILLQIPVYNSKDKATPGSGLIGLIDMISLKRIIFDQETKGTKTFVDSVAGDKTLVKTRCELIEKISDYDHILASHIIETEEIEKVPDSVVHEAIKRSLISSSTFVPVLLGSSYKNIGVQPLMDAIVAYFPSPTQLKFQDPVVNAFRNASEPCIYAFKSTHHKYHGSLTFIRLFSGRLKPGDKVYNITRSKTEKLNKIFLPFADDLKEVQSLGPGQVAVVSGLKDTITGDTLTCSHSVTKTIRKKLKLENDNEVGISGLSVPEPVFFCSVEPASLSQQKGLDAALECLQREDPSLRVRIDPDTNQTILSGMGELHLEILHERLKSDFKVDADLGKLMVAYKETIIEPITNRLNYQRKIGDLKHSIEIELSLIPTTTPSPNLILKKGKGKEIQEHLASVPEKYWKNIANGIESALRVGPKLGFPVINVEAHLNWFLPSRGTGETVIEVAAANCIRQALHKSETASCLLEPIVQLIVTVDERYQPVVLDDLNRRRFKLECIELSHGNKVIEGLLPLSELVGYSTILRTISSGLATFQMKFSHYNRVSAGGTEEDKIIQQVRGF